MHFVLEVPHVVLEAGRDRPREHLPRENVIDTLPAPPPPVDLCRSSAPRKPRELQPVRAAPASPGGASKSGEAATPPSPGHRATLGPDTDADAAVLPLAPTVARSALAAAISCLGSRRRATAKRPSQRQTGSGLAAAQPRALARPGAARRWQS